MQLPTPTYTIKYDGKDITADIKPYVISITFGDHIDGKSDDLVIVVEDSSDQRWKNKWIVTKGAKLECTIGDLDCGTFAIDEVTASGKPDRVTISALATGYSTQLRTKKSKTHAQKKLGEIVSTIAQANNLTVQGTPASILIAKATQKHKSDLHYLHQLGKKYGHIVSVRKNTLTFMPRYEMEKQASAASIDKTDCLSYVIRDKFPTTYSAAVVRYFDPKTAELIEGYCYPKVQYQIDQTRLCTPDLVARNYQRLYKNGVPPKQKTGFDEYINEYQSQPEVTKPSVVVLEKEVMKLPPDTLVIHARVENKQQAEEMAKSALYNANTNQRTVSLEIPGNEYCLAGNNFRHTNQGNYSGMYSIQSSKHIITRDGSYRTSIEAKQITVSVRVTKTTPVVRVAGTSGKYIDDVNNGDYRGGIRRTM